MALCGSALQAALVGPQERFAAGCRSLAKLATAYVLSIAEKQPFHSGNLAVAFLAAITFLRVSGATRRLSEFTGSIQVVYRQYTRYQCLCTTCIMPVYCLYMPGATSPNPRSYLLWLNPSRMLPRVNSKAGSASFSALNSTANLVSAACRTGKSRPPQPRRPTCHRFRAASKFANSTLTDPAQNTRYSAAAARNGSTAYNVAVSDFMHSPGITEVNLTRHTRRAGQSIRIRGEEEMTGAAAVNVVIADGTRVV